MYKEGKLQLQYLQKRANRMNEAGQALTKIKTNKIVI